MQTRLRARWESFTKEQKLSVILLGFCGFFAVGLSLYQMNLHVHEPFLTDKASAIAFKQSLTPSPDEQDAKLQRTDTDGDGLSDWDEINVYHLNPNLKDTCGDGILDNIRVATGKNLVSAGVGNPSGAVDTTPIENATSAYSNIQQTSNAGSGAIVSQAIQAAGTVQQDTSAQVAPVQPAVSSTFSIPRDPAAIRNALQGQVSQDALNAISDTQLLQYYDQALSQQNAASTSTSL